MNPVAEFRGGEKSVGRAPETLQWLVMLAEAVRGIEYGQFAKLLGVHHRAVDKILGVIGDALQRLDVRFGKIPLIQLLVVNKKTMVPGDSGLRWFMPNDEQRAKLSLQERRVVRDGVQQQIFTWPDWREVLAAFDLDPLAFGALPLEEALR